MDIYHNKDVKNKPIMKLYVSDIDFYARQLLELVTVYRKHIYLQEDRDVKILNELEYYARQLMNRQYDSLITNANEIISYQDELPF